MTLDRAPSFLALAVVSVLSCRTRASDPITNLDSGKKAIPGISQAPLDLLRESARDTLDANCAECHTKGLATALPRALRVFDLTERDWSVRMTDAQLREAARRLGEPFAPTRGEAEVRPIRISDSERTRFEQFVVIEVARRNGSTAR